jgi:hypothetical protein
MLTFGHSCAQEKFSIPIPMIKAIATKAVVAAEEFIGGR